MPLGSVNWCHSTIQLPVVPEARSQKHGVRLFSCVRRTWMLEEVASLPWVLMEVRTRLSAVVGPRLSAAVPRAP